MDERGPRRDQAPAAGCHLRDDQGRNRTETKAEIAPAPPSKVTPGCNPVAFRPCGKAGRSSIESGGARSRVNLSCCGGFGEGYVEAELVEPLGEAISQAG